MPGIDQYIFGVYDFYFEMLGEGNGDGKEKAMAHTAIKVPGKKNAVRMAMDFMAELSRLAASATFFDSTAADRLARLSRWENRL